MSVLSEKVRNALFAKINTAGVLTLATGGVHYLVAPQKSNYPMVVFSRVPKEKIYGLVNNNLIYETDLWLVKALTDEDSSNGSEPQDLGERILNAVETAVNNSLTIGGGSILIIRRQTDIPAYTEALDGRLIFHQGTYFLITTQ